MKPIKITQETIQLIAEVEYEAVTGDKLSDLEPTLQIGWESGARYMLDTYNRVVEILSTLPEYSSGDEQ